MFLAHPQEARGSERKPHEYVKRRSGVKGYKNKSPHEKAGFLSIDKQPLVAGLEHKADIGSRLSGCPLGAALQEVQNDHDQCNEQQQMDKHTAET